MNFSIKDSNAFSVIGQEVELTNYQKKNIQISTQFWKKPIPKRTIIPENFLYKEIPSYKYLVVEHIGDMDKIYETYGKLYQEIIPGTPYIPIKDIILHFEKYDSRFQWNRDNSVTEIWIPIQN